MRPYSRKEERKFLHDLMDSLNKYPPNHLINYGEQEGNKIYEGRNLTYECDDEGIFRIYSAEGNLVYEREREIKKNIH